MKLGFGRLSQNGEISTGTHLIVIPEIECGVVTGQSDASILIVYRQFLLQVETGLLDNQTIEEKIKNLISQLSFQIDNYFRNRSIQFPNKNKCNILKNLEKSHRDFMAVMY